LKDDGGDDEVLAV